MHNPTRKQQAQVMYLSNTGRVDVSRGANALDPVSPQPRTVKQLPLPKIPSPVTLTLCLRKLSLALDTSTIKKVARESNKLFQAHYKQPPRTRASKDGVLIALHEVEVVRLVCIQLGLLKVVVI